MNRVQRLFTSIVPKGWAESMEAESRMWMMKCPNCAFEQSIWDMGGIRWKAYGNSKNLIRCPNCGKRSWHTLYKKSQSEIG
ncbi:MAG: hypothetical protein ABI700_08090 [Chloroflexota bacterium]